MPTIDQRSNNFGYLIFPSSFCVDGGDPGFNNGLPVSDEQWATDMTQPIQDAIDITQKRGVGTLAFRPNRYPIKRTIRIKESKLTITSRGQGDTSQRDPNMVPVFDWVPDTGIGSDNPMAPAEDSMFRIAADNPAVPGELILGIKFENVVLQSIGRETLTGLIHAVHAIGLQVTKCRLGGIPTPGGVLPKFISVDRTNSHQGAGIWIDRLQGESISSSGQPSEFGQISWLHRIRENNFFFMDRHALVNEGSDSWIESNYASSTAGFREQSNSGNIYTNNFIDLCRGIQGGKAFSMVELDSDDPTTPGATIISNNRMDINEVGIELADNTRAVTIIGNKMRDNSLAHIDLKDAQDITLTGNSLRFVPLSIWPNFDVLQFSGTPNRLAITGNIIQNLVNPALSAFLFGGVDG